MSARNYAILWVGAHSGGGGAFGTALGGTVLTKTPPHKLDGPEHLTADDTALLDATTSQHGLLPKLSGSSGDVLRGDGTFGPEAGGPAFATPSIALGSSAAAGAASTVIRSDSTIAAFDGTAPVTQAMGDAAAVGSAAFAARRDHKHGMPSFATNAIVLGTAAAAGAASTPLRSNDTIAAFDATVPTTQALGDSAATGSAAFAARRDHTHGMPALSTATPLIESGSGAVGTGTASSREDHVHPAATSGSAHYLTISSGHSTPLVFDDIIQSSAGNDFIYSS